MCRPKQITVLASWVLASSLLGQTLAHVEMTKVESRRLSRTVTLPSQLEPWLSTDIEARVPGYIRRVLVDRGSKVHTGQVLIELAAPEMEAQTSAAEAALHQAEGEVSQAAAQAAAASATFERMQQAAQTPGAVAGNELTLAEKEKDAADALLQSRKSALRTATERLSGTKDMQGYLRVTAPFDGIITDRFVHPGMMVDANGHQALLKLQQVSRLRLAVPVPESYVGAIERGKTVAFHVPAFPGKTYSGSIARVAHALDPQNRTMMVELDVSNRDGSLAPGMYPTVDWPVVSGDDVLLVPASAVVTTTERTFVITAQDGKAHWVDVRKGPASGEMVVVRGSLKPGEMVVLRATDEIREGSRLR
jgi:membrane fusion protein, multidrug efflux system